MKDKILNSILGTTLQSATFLTGKLAPLLVDQNKITVSKNVSYGPEKEHLLDIYQPKGVKQPLPISILIHGGGFRYFSKNSHATAAGQLASNGQLVFCIDYRLTPKHPYPAGLIDTINAYSWIIENAKKYGGDLNNISLVGESAGGNYALALCLYLFGIQSLDPSINLPKIPDFKPKHAVIHCGHLHVSNVDRYVENKKNHHPLVLRRILQIQRDYLPAFESIPKDAAGLADPLVEIEKLAQNKSSLPESFPQIFVPVGDQDPVKGDSIRLAQALESLGQKNRLKNYPNEGHAFYVLPFSKNAKTCWQDIISFLKS